MAVNGYFRVDDPHPENFYGFPIPEGWWSRRYEYDWAIRFAAGGQIVADMGCGWHYRPFHDALSNICEFTFGVDQFAEVLKLPPMTNGAFVVADFAKPIRGIPGGSLDRIFCISVLEELIDYRNALAEFKRLLKPDGRIVLTCDMPYDENKPAHDKYKGVRLDELEAAIRSVGLGFDGDVDRTKYGDLLHNDEFNLCVWHMALKYG